MVSLKVIFAALVGVFLAIFISIGVTPHSAIAPTQKIPEKLSTTTEQTVKPQATSTPKKTAVVPAPAKTPATTTTSPKPKTDTQIKIQDTVETITKTLEELRQQELLNSVPPDFKTLNETVRKTIVNIICTTEAAGPLNAISASGVIVDPKGIIMTNAHVGQYFLLKNYLMPNFVTCIIRTGSPAMPQYTAELLFLPPSWINANASKLIEENPTGNGEHDYALIRITGTVNPNIVLPTSFPYLPISLDSPVGYQQVLLAGYPAGFLGGITILKDLYAGSSVAKIGELYTFQGSTLDLFSVGGSIVAQQGSSGGAVATLSSTLLGVIVTSSEAPDTASRDLRALSTQYIAEDFAHESGKALSDFLSGDIIAEGQAFLTGTAPTLTQTLVNVLQNNN